MITSNYKCECKKCGRKILVSIWFPGVPHVSGIDACCAECLEILPEWEESNRKEAAEIREWTKGQKK